MINIKVNVPDEWKDEAILLRKSLKRALEAIPDKFFFPGFVLPFFEITLNYLDDLIIRFSWEEVVFSPWNFLPYPIKNLEENLARRWLKPNKPFPSEWEYLVTFGETWRDYNVRNFTGTVNSPMIVIGGSGSGNIIVEPKTRHEKKELIQVGILEGIILLKLFPGVVVKSREQIEQEEKEAQRLLREKCLQDAQQFLGWTITEITSSSIKITSPTGQEASITSHHSSETDDYSRNWLGIGGISLQ